MPILNKGGLPIPLDLRDKAYARHKLKSQRIKYGSLGVPNLDQLPAEYRATGTVSDDNQLDSLFCTDYATVAIAERLDGKAYSRAYHAKCESEILGYNMANVGCDLRTAFEVATSKGFLPKELEPFDWKVVGAEYAADPKNWPENIDATAHNSEKNYTWISGPYDPFHSMRAHLVDLGPTGTISVAIPWFQEWEEYLQKGGDKILPMPTNNIYSFHDSVVSGYIWKNGKRVLVNESWQGSVIGEVYFTQEVFNYAMSFSGTGAGTLEKIQPNDVNSLKKKLLTMLQTLLALFLNGTSS